MGELQLRIGNLAEAEALLKRAIAIDEEQFEPDKSETASDLDLLGRVYLEQGRLKEARAAFEMGLGTEAGFPAPPRSPPAA
jgi:tetratricopeptide (TPR) repeat protein